jgi:hypothetical protein
MLVGLQDVPRPIKESTLMRFRCSVCGYIHEGNEPPETCPVCGAGREEFLLEAEETAVPATKPMAAEAPASSTDPRWVVLGGGIAGLSTIEAAREANPEALITLVHREASLPYSRLNLTRYLAGADAVIQGTPPATQLKVLAWPVFSMGRFEPEAPEDRVLERADGDAALAAALRRAVQEKLALAAVPELGFLSDKRIP